MKVLLGIGGSDDSFTALEAMTERVRSSGDELSVAIVDNPESSLSIQAVEERVRRQLNGSGLPIDLRRVSGDPGSQLVEIAEREGFDAIALGGGQRSPMGKLSLGQIAEFVLLNACVSVILVR